MANSLLRSSLLHLPPSHLPLLYTISPFAPPGNGDLLPSKPYRRKEMVDGARGFRSPPPSRGFKVNAAAAEKEGPKWWEKNVSENMIDIDSTEEFLTVLSEAGEKLVVVEFYGTWCASCRALFPKLCRTAKENPDILFIKVNFDENKPMCRRLNVKVLPYFHFYRGADGLLESFSCSLAKFQKIKNAIAIHNTARCSIGPPAGVGDLDLSGDLGSLAEKDQPAKTGSR